MFEKLPSLRQFQPKFFSGGPTRFHLPLIYDVVGDTKPKRAVVVGFADGQAFFTFCQAANEQGIDCECDAVRRGESEPANADGAWTNGRSYGEEFYGEHARFFADGTAALHEIADGTVDLLWLDDCDSGSELRQDLAAWEAKLSVNALVF